MKNRVILYGQDDGSVGSPMLKKLIMQFPQAEVMMFRNANDYRTAIETNENRIAALILDEYFPTPNAGTGIARDVRGGKFGEKVRGVPIIIASGDPHPEEMVPPVKYITSSYGWEKRVFAFVAMEAFGSGSGDEKKEFTQQDARNVAARKLIGYFPPRAFLMRDKNDPREKKISADFGAGLISEEHVIAALKTLDESRVYTQQNQPLHTGPRHEIHGAMQNRMEEMRIYAQAAFKGGTPSNDELRGQRGLLEELITAIDRDHLHVTDDQHAMQYKMFVRQLRGDCVMALQEQEGPLGDEYVKKGREY